MRGKIKYDYCSFLRQHFWFVWQYLEPLKYLLLSIILYLYVYSYSCQVVCGGECGFLFHNSFHFPLSCILSHWAHWFSSSKFVLLIFLNICFTLAYILHVFHNVENELWSSHQVTNFTNYIPTLLYTHNCTVLYTFS